ncbi:MAG: diphthamide biosynthesis enzyme Dph2 [Candidatus Bathyarchaeota archaeon]|nr:diphthamide biosynthesis enzyme Dph2 [Candidatus Bathyarchaeota archaeon]
MSFNFEVKKVLESIVKLQAKRVLLQLPEGLKPYGNKILTEIGSKTDATIFISADPCYGACDLALDAAKNLNVDLIIHYGHTPFKHLKNEVDGVKVLYIKAEATTNLAEVLTKIPSAVKPYRNIGLASNIQHVHKLNDVKIFLENEGFKVYIGKAGGLAVCNGQILGCDYTTVKNVLRFVDAYLYIGGGIFHPLGIFLETRKPVFSADLYTGNILDVSIVGGRILAYRKVALAKLVEASSVGILVGLKPGQKNMKLAEDVYKVLRKNGKNVFLFCLNEITPENLENFPGIDVYVNTACPRVGLDDYDKFSKPIILPKEVFEVYG